MRAGNRNRAPSVPFIRVLSLSVTHNNAYRNIVRSTVKEIGQSMLFPWNDVFV
jgi:hypothetical protein